MNGLRLLQALFCAALLAACGSDKTSTPEYRALFQAVGTKFSGMAKPARVPPMTRAGLDQLGTPLLFAKLQSRDAEATLGLLESNPRAETWATADGITLSLRDGIVVATRGLGPDLMGSTAPQAKQILAEKPYARSYSWLDGADVMVTATYECTPRRIGAERLVIVERAYVAQHVAETCAPVPPGNPANGTQVENAYWFESSGKIRQSTQWLGPVAGNLSLQGLNP